MTLRERVEREMREAANRVSCPHLDAHENDLSFCCAVDVALRLLSEYGHVKMCQCQFPSGTYIDPRCAQPGGEEGKA